MSDDEDGDDDNDDLISTNVSHRSAPLSAPSSISLPSINSQPSNSSIASSHSRKRSLSVAPTSETAYTKKTKKDIDAERVVAFKNISQSVGVLATAVARPTAASLTAEEALLRDPKQAMMVHLGEMVDKQTAIVDEDRTAAIFMFAKDDPHLIGQLMSGIRDTSLQERIMREMVARSRSSAGNASSSAGMPGSDAGGSGTSST